MTLAALQSRLRDLVVASDLLADRPILIEDKGNLVSDLEAALATVALAVVIALASGEVKDGSLPRRAAWRESFEVVIHRGPIAEPESPSTLAILEDLRTRIHGAPVDPAKPSGAALACSRHELRENGDGSYARVLTVTTTLPV